MSVEEIGIVAADSILEESFHLENNNDDCNVNFNLVCRKRSHLRPICKKKLKNKLKKYKIRRDGIEDPEVAGVAELLSQSTFFHSLDKDIEDLTDTQPRNYIAKMVRRKRTEDAKVKEDQKVLKEIKTMTNCKVEAKKNAFALLMDSRNKSIGGNSPGKDRPISESEFKEIDEKKKSKLKMNLALQKMADAKGAAKNQKLEDYREKCIKKKMERRAELLKTMITKSSPKQKKTSSKKSNVSQNNQPLVNSDQKISLQKEVMATTPIEAKSSIQNQSKRNKNVDKPLPIIGQDLNNQGVNKESGTDVVPNGINSPETKKNAHTKNITDEDKEFLQKLSPSLKKKENMLCYFQKLQKVNSIEEEDEDENKIIKVKLSLNSRKKLKKRKLSLAKTNTIDLCTETKEKPEKDCNGSQLTNCLSKLSCIPSESDIVNLEDIPSRKRKRKANCNVDEKPILEDESSVAIDSVSTEGRPRRSVRKPVKYTDDSNLLSSDDELRIFSPKKKKNSRTIDCTKTPKKSEKVESGLSKKQTIPKKPDKKLAPIFMPKPIIDSEILEARQKFLHSGVPDQIKKIAIQHKVHSTVCYTFPITVNVTQNSDISVNENLKAKVNFFNLMEKGSEETSNMETSKIGYKSLLDLSTSNIEILTKTFENNNCAEVLQNIKAFYPEFPVYRTYKSLKNKSNGENTDITIIDLDNSKETLNGVFELKVDDPKTLNWTEKYRAYSTNQIIGNFESIKEIKKWLNSWVELNLTSKNSQSHKDSDSSDFYQSDADSRDNAAMSNNVLVICGPSGSGKTSSVYAVAAELAIKVIEVNVSSKRTGKILLQNLQEATKSHKVNRGKGSSAENSQNSQNIREQTSSQGKKPSKKSKQKADISQALKNSESLSQSSSVEDGRTGMSLILIDDADIIFEQDDGFISAVAQMIQSSKRPVVLVTSSMSCAHLQKFYQSGNNIMFKPLLPRMLGTWLDIMCLADTGTSWPGSGQKILEYHRGDIRKAINSLQFYASSQAEKLKIESKDDVDDVKFNPSNMCDENSSMSWAGGDCIEEVQKKPVKSQNEAQCIPRSFYCYDNFSIWWNAHDILNSSTKMDNKEHSLKKLEDISKVLDCLSLTDYKMSQSSNNVCSSPWYTQETDSVVEKHSYEEVNNFHDACSEISSYLVKSSFSNVKDCNTFDDHNVTLPGSHLQREKDKILSRHHLLSESFVPSSVLDRKSIALDYWSTFRHICRSEKLKTDTNCKRNNRFYHYLKTTKTAGKTDVFNKLCNSLECDTNYYEENAS